MTGFVTPVCVLLRQFTNIRGWKVYEQVAHSFVFHAFSMLYFNQQYTKQDEELQFLHLYVASNFLQNYKMITELQMSPRNLPQNFCDFSLTNLQ